MNNIIIIFLIFNVFLASLSQILLKTQANKHEDTFIKQFLNFNIIIAYTIILLITFINIFLYKYISLSLIIIIDSLGFIFVPLLSCFFFKEKLNKKQLIGILLIIFGLAIYSF